MAEYAGAGSAQQALSERGVLGHVDATKRAEVRDMRERGVGAEMARQDRIQVPGGFVQTRVGVEA